MTDCTLCRYLPTALARVAAEEALNDMATDVGVPVMGGHFEHATRVLPGSVPSTDSVVCSVKESFVQDTS